MKPSEHPSVPPEHAFTGDEVLRVINTYANDPGFRESADRDLHDALAEHGIDIPRDVGLRLCRNTEETFHFVLPADPNRALVDQELTGAVGGSSASTVGSAGSFGTVSSFLSCAGTASSAGSVGSAGTAS